MRYLVVGTVPPPGGEGARALAASVGELVAEGHVVEVLSPDPRSAAHRQGSLRGPLLGLRLALLARRFDALVLRIERDLPLADQSGRVARTLALGTCGAALRLWREVTIRVDSPVPIPGGVGGRATRGLWSSASRIVVGTEEDRTALLRAEGVDPERVEVVAADPPAAAFDDRGWTAGEKAPSREAILTLVRTRAVRERSVNTARISLGAHGVGPVDRSPFAEYARPRPSATGVARLVAGRARRSLSALRPTR